MEDFSPTSERKLSECHPDLQQVARIARKLCRFEIDCGFRDQQWRQKAFEEGRSKLQWPESKHNGQPAQAFDFVPLPFDYGSVSATADPAVREAQLTRLYYIAGIIRGTANMLGVPVRMGCDWNRDGNTSNDSFRDAFHCEMD